MTFEIKNIPGAEVLEYQGKVLTLPQRSGKVLLEGPACSVYPSGSQAFASTGVWTKVVLNTEEYDYGANFDVALSRFTPAVAGLYLVNASVLWNAGTGFRISAVYKNGAEYKRGPANYNATAGQEVGSPVNCLVPMNGTTDYIEFYAVQGSGGSLSSYGSAAYTYFQAMFVRQAA